MAPGEVFRINYRLLGYDSIYVNYYKPQADIPRPSITQNSPSSFPFVADTSLVLAYSDSVIFSLPEKGMYHFRIDSSADEGVSIHNFGSDYPQVKTEESLYEPLFYIATLTEYRKMAREPNLKRAVDDFWLKRSNSMDRSRELIRVYYSRVLYSNLFFGADREGWKTDRGMVFILFGPPDRMRDSGAEQRWYYISRRQGKVIEFVFERKPSAFSNNDLIWKKSIESMQYWNAALSSWRSGKVYSLGKS
jgi:GWxTD domain-containing protein